MLALCGKNPSGNVLHVVVGPETELFTDIHGAKILDITPALRQMDFDKRVFISLTRCRSEAASASLMRSSGIEFLTSFQDALDTEDDDMQAVTKASCNVDAAAAEQHPLVVNNGECDYCHVMKALVPIPGFKICQECNQIELGLGRVPDEENTVDDVPNAADIL